MAYINPKYPAVEVTQAEYDAMQVHDAHTMYCIPDAEPTPVLPIIECTQAEYDAMQTYDPDVLYAIPGVTS